MGKPECRDKHNELKQEPCEMAIMDMQAGDTVLKAPYNFCDHILIHERVWMASFPMVC